MSNVINSGGAVIRKIIKDKHIALKDLTATLQSKGYNIKEGVLSNKLQRDTLTLNEFTLIANALDCDVKTISNDNKIVYSLECDVEKATKKFNNTSKKMQEISNDRKLNHKEE